LADSAAINTSLLGALRPGGVLAVIDFPLDDWSKIHPKSGRLDRFVVPKALESEIA